MASLVKNGKTYGLIWTDSSREPQQIGESLKTDNHKKAKRLKSRLEDQYFTIDKEGNREHDPWYKKWYEQSSTGTQISVGDAVESFIIYKSKTKGNQGWNETTAKNETLTMRKFSRFIGKEKPLETISEKNLESFYYRDKVNSDWTRKSLYISINTFLNWCIEQNFISDKPEFKPKKPQAKLPKFIWPEDFAKLIQDRIKTIEGYIKNNPVNRTNQYAWWGIYGWMILAGTGMRPIELANLKTHHVEEHSILIGEDFTTKVRAERRVPLLFESRVAAQALVNPYFRSLEPHMKDSPYLLGRSPKSAKDKLSRQFSNTWKESFPDQPKRTLYNLKDMFAVRYLSTADSGLALNSLKEILGHSSLETTQKYLKAVPPGTKITGTIWDFLST